MRIIESIVVCRSSDADHTRLTHPHPGDIFRAKNSHDPIIAEGAVGVYVGDDQVIWNPSPMPWLGEGNTVDSSGGPQMHIKPAGINALCIVAPITFQTWAADAGSGASKACEVTLQRPVFEYDFALGQKLEPTTTSSKT